MKRLVLAVFCVVALVAFVGCGPDKKEVEIKGSATLDGKPIDFGIVQFFNEAAEGGGNVQDGKYTARVPKGELTVRIRGYEWTGPEPEVPEQQEGAAPGVPPQRPRKSITPEDMWLNPTYKIDVAKGGTYDLEFTSN